MSIVSPQIHQQSPMAIWLKNARSRHGPARTRTWDQSIMSAFQDLRLFAAGRGFGSRTGFLRGVSIRRLRLSPGAGWPPRWPRSVVSGRLVGGSNAHANTPDAPVSPILKQPPNPAENTSTVGIEDRPYMRRTPPPPSPPPGRPSRQPLPHRRTGAGIRLLLIALVGIILILATMLTVVEAERCREGFQAQVCRI